jgi:hypothetical protein
MKILTILLASLCLTEARSLSRSEEEKLPELRFSPEKNHRFRYSTHLVSGIPRSSSLHAGLKVESDVELFPTKSEYGTQEIQIKFMNPRIFTILDRLQAQNPLEPISSHQLQELNSRDYEQEYRDLQKPIKIKMTSKGKIEDISFDRDDSIWSKNLKRGLVSNLQMNLNKDRVVSMETILSQMNIEIPRELPSNIDQILDKSEDEVMTYTVMENGISGDCETEYMVRSDPSQCSGIGEKCRKLSEKPERIEVRKTRSYERCQSRPEHRFSFLTGFRMKEGWTPSQQKSFISSPTTVKVILKKEEGKYTVEKMTVKGKHVFSPYDEVKGSQETSVRSDLSFDRTESQRPSWIKSDSDFTSSGSSPEEKLQLEIPEDHMINRFVPSGLDEKRVSLIKKLFRDVSEKHSRCDEQPSSSTSESDGEETMMKQVDLVNLLRQCSKEELDKLNSDISSTSSSSSEYKPRDFWLMLLSTCGTPQSTKVLLSELRRDFHTSDLSKLFEIMSKLVVLQKIPKPTKEITDDLLSYCKDVSSMTDSDKKYSLLEKECWYTFGTLVDGVCNKVYKTLNEMTSPSRTILMSKKEKRYFDEKCPESVMNKYTQEYRTQLSRVSSQPDRKIVILNSMTNSKVMVVKMMKEISDIINNKNEKETVRSSTIVSLGVMAPFYPDQITSLLTPIFKDRSEKKLVRTSSFTVLVLANSLPTRKSVMTNLISDLKDEPSIEMRTYIYNAVLQLSNTTKGLWNDAHRETFTSVYHMIKDISVDKNMLSGWYRFSHKFHEYNLGFLFDVHVLPSIDSKIPRGLWADSYVQLKDHLIPLTIGGFSVEGISDVISKYYSRSQSSSSSSSSSSRSDQFSFALHTEFLANLNHVFGGYFDEQTLNNLISNPSNLLRVLSSLRNGIDLNQRWGMMWSIHNQVPTEVGIPLDLNVTLISEVKGHGKVRGELRPEPSFGSFFTVPDSLNVNVDVKTKGDHYVHMMMSPRLPFLIPGSKVLTKVSHQIPLNFESTFDIRSKMVHVIVKNMNKEYKVGSVKVEPHVCVIKRKPEWRQESKPITGEEKCSIRNLDIKVPDENKFKSPISLKVRGTFPTGKPDHMAKFPLDGYRKYEFVYDGSRLPSDKKDFEITMKIESHLFSSSSSSSSSSMPKIKYPQLWRNSGSSSWFSSSSSPSNVYTDSLTFPSSFDYKVLSSSSSSSSSSPKSSRVTVQIKPKSSPESESLTCKVEVQHDFISRKGIFDVQIVNPSSSPQMLEKFQGCGRLEIDASNTEEPKFGGKFGWGDSCQDKKVQFKVESTRKSSSDMDREFDEIKNIEKCERRGDRYEGSRSCGDIESMKLLNRMVKGEISWDNIPETLKKKTRDVWDIVKAYTLWKTPLRIEREPRSNSGNKVEFEVDLRPYLHRDEIKFPTETLKLQGTLLPKGITSTFRRYISLWRSSYGTCTISSNGDILTVDKTMMKFSMLSGCENIVSADCQDKSYIVTTSKPSSSGMKPVKIYLDNKRDTIELRRDYESSRVTVRVNGNEKSSLPYTLSSSDGSKSCDIRYGTSDKEVTVNCKTVKVRTDCKDIEVESKIPERKVCGLCNNYWTEQRSNDHVIHYQDPQQLISNLDSLVSGQCRRDDVRSSVSSSSSSRPSSSSSSDCRPKETTQVLERDNKICFSTRPVMRCPRGCIPSDNLQTKYTGYRCVEKSSSDARQYFDRSQNGEYIRNFDGQSPDFTHDTADHERCDRL